MTSSVDFSHEVDPKSVGMRHAKVKELAKTFESEISEKHWHPAAQLVVLRHGQVVLDRALGSGNRGLPINHDTPFYCFSVSKPFTALCVHRLIEEGRISLDARVADYWPEWGCKGKESATIRHVLLHQAGIPKPQQEMQVFSWTNWERLIRVIATYPAEFTPGAKTGYHQLNYGFILGEVVQRVTGKPIDEYFSEIFVKPMGLQHTLLRMPKSWRPRVPKHVSMCKEQDLNAFVFNLPAVRTALMPAASLTSNARGLAEFFQMLLNGGEYGGSRYVKKATIVDATKISYEGEDIVFHIHQQLGMGFFLGRSLVVPIPPERTPLQIYGRGGSQHTFGHLGLGSGMVWADWKADVVVAFCCNGLWHDGIAGPRWSEISDGVWDALD